MIHCVGVGPGDPDYMTQLGLRLIKQADIVAGFQAVTEIVKPFIGENSRIMVMRYRDQVEKLRTVAALHQEGMNCVVLFMGDPHFSGFQLLERVELACGHRVETVPGISSAQVLASRCRIAFDETTFITFHRRGEIGSFKEHLVHVIKDGRNAIVIPRPWDFMPRDISLFLVSEGVPSEHSVDVWERLTQSEAAWIGNLGNCAGAFSDMSIMLIRTLRPMASQIEPMATPAGVRL